MPAGTAQRTLDRPAGGPVQDGPCLVAVGAVHLPGVDGLLAALRRDGYTIEAMPL